MLNITYKQIMSFCPCYSPQEIGMNENYEDNIVNFIKEYRDKVKSKDDILWVLCRNDFLSNKELRLFAVWCARQVQHLMQDERSINALTVVESYAHGACGDDDLDAARAARDADTDAAEAAAWAAASAAASAARAAAWATAWDAACAARAAAWATAWDAACAAQIDQLLKIFEGKKDA